MKKNVLLNLINDYQNEVQKFMERFESKYKCSDVLRAWREEIIEKEGHLPDGIEFELHGIGCRIYYPDHEVDFDFGPENRSDGFDLWRLKKYLSQRKDIQQILSVSELEAIFKELEHENIIAKIYDNSNLHFFVKSK